MEITKINISVIPDDAKCERLDLNEENIDMAYIRALKFIDENDCHNSSRITRVFRWNDGTFTKQQFKCAADLRHEFQAIKRPNDHD